MATIYNGFYDQSGVGLNQYFTGFAYVSDINVGANYTEPYFNNVVGGSVGGSLVENGQISASVTSGNAFGETTTVSFEIWQATKIPKLAFQVGGGSFSVTTFSRDVTPATITFTPVTFAALSTQYTSNSVAISGINDSISIQATGGEISVNGGAFTTSAVSANNGDTIRLRRTSSGSLGTLTSVTAAVVETSTQFAQFDITTLPVDTTPDAFTFTDQSGVTLSTLITSNTITIAGVAAAATVSFSTSGTATGFQAQKNALGWVTATGSPFTVNNGDTVQLRMTSAPAGSGVGNIVLSIGSPATTDTWTVTALTTDTTPDAFTFTDIGSAGISTVQTSNVITITGIDAAANVSFSTTNGSAHEYRKNGGAWTAVGATTVVNNDTLQVRHTAANTFPVGSATTMTVGGVSDAFNVTSSAVDNTPNAFDFVNATGAQLLTLTTLAAITITGINAPTAISISGADAQYSINGGAYTSSPGTINNNDSVAVRLTSAAQYVTAINAVLTIGAVSDTFSVTTRSPSTASQYVRTFRETAFGVAP